MSLGFLAGLVFMAAGGSVLGVYALYITRERHRLQRTVDTRLDELTGFGPPPDAADAGSLLREQPLGPLPSVDRVARRALTNLGVELWLEQTGVRLTVSGLCLLMLASAVMAGFLTAVFAQLIWAALIGAAVGAFLPIGVLRYRRSRRLYKFEEHFPEALDLMSRAVRAGHAFSAGLKMVADEMREPVGPEFRKTFDEQNYGLPLKDSLANLASRVPLVDVKFFGTAILIQRETGGNLSEILDNLANVVRERFKIRRQVRVHTAHGRFTGYVLLGIPAFLAVTLSILSPEHMGMMFNDPMGQTMVMIGIGMQVVGWFWIRQVIKIEV